MLYVAVEAGKVIMALRTVKEILTHIKTTKGRDLYEVTGLVTDDLLDALSTEWAFESAISWYESEHGMKIRKLEYVDFLDIGYHVKLRDGSVAEITSSIPSPFLYNIEGVSVPGSRSRYLYSWTNKGFYYTNGIENYRDIVEVICD